MSSSVFFKFKSQKEHQRVPFDGTGISVFELKREIISISRLGDGTDFDLAIYNEDTNEEYSDDTVIIPRSTSIIARRLPPIKPGQGKAARYVSGKMPVNAKNAYRTETAVSKPAVSGRKSPGTSGQSLGSNQTEEEKIAAMFAAGNAHWEEQKLKMANVAPVHFKLKGKTANVPDHDPPAGYVCYRCGNKGHWIQACPTNDDPNFDGRPRVTRTTGIPKSFLKVIEKPQALIDDGLTDESRQPSRVMVNAEGQFVVAEPDKASWEQYQAKTQISAAQQEAATAASKEVEDLGLACPIDKRVFVDPKKTPCCGRTYCNDCIENALINSDFVCPGCSVANVLIDSLITDEDMVAKMKVYEDGKKAAQSARDVSKSPTLSESGKAGATKSRSPLLSAPDTANKVSTPKMIVNGMSNKRSAEDDLHDNLRDGPSGAKKQKSGSQAVDSNEQFFHHMNALAQSASSSFPNGSTNAQQLQSMSMPGFPDMSGMMGMPSNMGGMSGIPAAMMNPMFFQQQNAGAWPNMGGMDYSQYQQAMMAGYNANMLMQNAAYGQQPWQYGQMWGANGMVNNPASGMQPFTMQSGENGVFPNQQRTVFSAPFPSEADSPYMRQPVNPQRHQNRQKRARPSDYREL